MSAAGTLDPRRLRPALKVAWGFVDPPPAQPLDTPAAGRSRVVRLSALLQWLPLAGAALALIALRLAARRRGAAARGGLRGARVARARARPVPRQHGLQPGDPDRRRRAADDGRDPLSPGSASRTASPAFNRPVIAPAAAARPGDALRPLRRARLRLPGREALRRALAGHRRRPRATSSRRPARAATPAALGARAQPAERDRLPAGPQDDPPAAARAAARLRRSRTRASTATRTPCRACSWSGSQRTVHGEDAALARRSTGRLRRRAGRR